MLRLALSSGIVLSSVLYTFQGVNARECACQPELENSIFENCFTQIDARLTRQVGKQRLVIRNSAGIKYRQTNNVD